MPQQFQYSGDLLDFWKEKKTLFPSLYKAALLILTVRTSSADVECSFSDHGNITTPLRNRMKQETLKHISLIIFNTN